MNDESVYARDQRRRDRNLALLRKDVDNLVRHLAAVVADVELLERENRLYRENGYSLAESKWDIDADDNLIRVNR